MTDPLLACILARSDDEASAAWRRWRGSTDIDAIEWRDALMVPMVREELLQRLVAGDPDAPRLTGLVRRAWTYGTTRAAAARALVAQLASAGIGPVMIGGSLAAFLHRGGSGPIRPVTDIVLLVPRHHVEGTVAALRDLKWERTGRAVPAKARSWTTFVSMRHGKDTLRIAWRHVSTPPWRARVVERALFSAPTELLPIGALILSRLSAGGAWADSIPWQADLSLLASHPIDWDAVLHDAAHAAPDALGRLRDARGAIAAVPSDVPHAAPGARIERALWMGARAAILAAHRVTSRP